MNGSLNAPVKVQAWVMYVFIAADLYSLVSFLLHATLLAIIVNLLIAGSFYLLFRNLKSNDLNKASAKQAAKSSSTFTEATHKYFNNVHVARWQLWMILGYLAYFAYSLIFG